MWHALRADHDAVRDGPGGRVLATELRKRVSRLVDGEHCEFIYTGKVELKRAPTRGREEVWVKGGDGGLGQPIPLLRLPTLADAELRFGAVLERGRLLEYVVRLSGLTKVGDHPWMVSVELDPVPRGGGACGHPLLHVHAGRDHDVEPQLRVPLAPMRPEHALDWVLCQVLPGWEPAPWP